MFHKVEIIELFEKHCPHYSIALNCSIARFFAFFATLGYCNLMGQNTYKQLKSNYWAAISAYKGKYGHVNGHHIELHVLGQSLLIHTYIHQVPEE